MRVLVTGHRGYLGAVLVAVLRHHRFEVTGLDADWFAGCRFGRTAADLPEFLADFRDVHLPDLLPFDAVVHLAALSNDACADLNPALAAEINTAATVRLAALCREASVSRFVFASTCAVYGRSTARPRTEDDHPAPFSPYAQGKLAAERGILPLAGHAFSPTVLRFATLYGLSPMLRMDTFVNEFTGAALATGKVPLRSNGSSWRPVVHVEDAARAVAAVLRAPRENVHAATLNVVDSVENHRVIDVADRVCDAAGATRQWTRRHFDPRSYRVDGSRLLERLPGFRFRWPLDRGIEQLLVGLAAAGFTAADLRGDRFRRALRVQSLLEQGHLAPDLRASTTAVTAA